MSDDSAGSNNGRSENKNNLPNSEATLSARLDRLGQNLSRVRDNKGRQSQEEENEQEIASKASAMARGFRLSSELVAGVFVGAAIGWGFDRLLSTSPWGFIVFLLLGFAAGVINVMRAAGVNQNGGLTGQPKQDNDQRHT